jgi:hypothetical protein
MDALGAKYAELQPEVAALKRLVREERVRARAALVEHAWGLCQVESGRGLDEQSDPEAIANAGCQVLMHLHAKYTEQAAPRVHRALEWWLKGGANAMWRQQSASADKTSDYATEEEIAEFEEGNEDPYNLRVYAAHKAELEAELREIEAELAEIEGKELDEHVEARINLLRNAEQALEEQLKQEPQFPDRLNVSDLTALAATNSQLSSDPEWRLFAAHLDLYKRVQSKAEKEEVENDVRLKYQYAHEVTRLVII